MYICTYFCWGLFSSNSNFSTGVSSVLLNTVSINYIRNLDENQCFVKTVHLATLVGGEILSGKCISDRLLHLSDTNTQFNGVCAHRQLT